MKRRADDEPESVVQDSEMQEHPQEGNVENGEDKDDTQKPPFRTRRCMRWAQGNCHLGEACTFLHTGEVGTHFPCRNFLNGFCPRGRVCNFKHDYSNNVMLPPFGAPTMMPFHPGVAIPPPPPITRKNAAPCRHFERGYCSLGIACAFQHESGFPVNTSSLPANAKTTQCRHFEKGFCQLGDSCGFAHGEKEGSNKPAVPANATPTNICRHYERGFCRLGQTCGFQHPGYAPPGPTATYDAFQGQRPPFQTPEHPYANPYAQPAPSFFPFSPYAAAALPARQPIVASTPRRTTGEGQICRHWAKGFCQMDKKCAFRHPAN